VNIPIKLLQAYRGRLVKKGKLLEARAVERCLKILKDAEKTPSGKEFASN